MNTETGNRMSTENVNYLAKITYLVEDFKYNIKRLVGIRVVNENFEVEDLSLSDYIKYSSEGNLDFWNSGVEYYILKLDDLDKLINDLNKSLLVIKKDIIKRGHTRKNSNIIVGVSSRNLVVMDCTLSVTQGEVELIKSIQPVAIGEWGKEYNSKVYYNVFYVDGSFSFYPDGFDLNYHPVLTSLHLYGYYDVDKDDTPKDLYDYEMSNGVKRDRTLKIDNSLVKCSGELVSLNGIYSTLKNEHSSEGIDTLVLPSDCKYFSYSGCDINRLVLNKEIKKVLISPTEKFVYKICGLKELYISKSLDARSALELIDACINTSFIRSNFLKTVDKVESFESVLKYIKENLKADWLSKIEITAY